MAYQNFAGEQLTFDGIQFEDIFASNGGVLSSLKKYDKFIEISVNDPKNASKNFLERSPKIVWLATDSFVPGRAGKSHLCY